MEPWRVELQELAKTAGLTTEVSEKPREQPRKRTSQYSAATGRLIPPPSKGISRASSRAKTAQFISHVNTPGNLLDQPNIEDTVGFNGFLLLSGTIQFAQFLVHPEVKVIFLLILTVDLHGINGPVGVLSFAFDLGFV